jgi:hypothetical protein
MMHQSALGKKLEWRGLLGKRTMKLRTYHRPPQRMPVRHPCIFALTQDPQHRPPDLLLKLHPQAEEAAEVRTISPSSSPSGQA